MGYEIAGGLGVKMAKPDQEVVVMLGDGSYLMLNSEIATSVMLGLKLTIVLLDNRGFGCINRLQMATGGANFNNLLKDARHEMLPDIDFAAHAASLGAIAEKVASIADLEAALGKSQEERPHDRHRHRYRPAGLRPRPAAIGGMSRCPRSARASRSTRRARPMRKR